MPIYIPTGARVKPNSYPMLPSGLDSDRIKAIANAGGDLYHWFDVALTNGEQVEASGSAPAKLMDMWDERPDRLDLVSAGNVPPIIVSGANGAKALQITNSAGTEYVIMGASDNASLRIPDPNEWSVVIVNKPTEIATAFLTGSELGADVTVDDYTLNIRYIASSGYDQTPQLMNANNTVNRIYDIGREYGDRDHILAIGFDTVNGLTLSDDGFIRATNPEVTNGGRTALTDTKFQFFGIGNGVTTINFDGLFYAALVYRKNIFKPAYADYHAAVVSAYGDKLGLAHAFVA